MRVDAKTLAGTAILGALVVVFDYALKFSGLKFPFPWALYLKFDLTGVPIVLSMLLFGFMSGATTSAVAFLAILARSGDAIGPTMKALAEFATISGMILGHKMLGKNTTSGRAASFLLGATSRILVMFVANLIVQPLYYGAPFISILLLSPLLAVFNLIQGLLSMVLGYLIYVAVVQRVPTLVDRFRNSEA